MAKGDIQHLGDLTVETKFVEAVDMYSQKNYIASILTKDNTWNIIGNGNQWTIRTLFPIEWKPVGSDYKLAHGDVADQEKTLKPNINHGIYTPIAYELSDRVPMLDIENMAYAQAAKGYTLQREIVAMNELLGGTAQTTTTGTKITDRMSAAYAQYLDMWGNANPNELVFVVGSAGLAEIMTDDKFSGTSANLPGSLNEINNGTTFKWKGINVIFSAVFKTKEYALVSLTNGLVESPLKSGLKLVKLGYEQTADFNGGALKGSSAGVLKLCTPAAVILGKTVAGETALTATDVIAKIAKTFDGDLGATASPAPQPDVASAISSMSAKEQKALYEQLGVKKV